MLKTRKSIKSISLIDTNIDEIFYYQVSPWKRLRGGVVFLNEIPKTPSGKILRRKLRALLKQNRREVPSKL